MVKETTYGILCQSSDEKSLTTRVTDFLGTLDRTLSKTKSKSLLKARLPHRLKHIYFNLNKGVGSYFEIFPNEDLDGEHFFPDNPECAWILKSRLDGDHPNYDKEKTEIFISSVLEATGFEYMVLEEQED